MNKKPIFGKLRSGDVLILSMIFLYVFTWIFGPKIKHFLQVWYFKSAYKGVIIGKVNSRGVDYLEYMDLKDQSIEDLRRKEITTKAAIGDTI